MSREVMQQALEFCETVHEGCTDSNDGTVEAITVWCPELIDALRAALDAPAAVAVGAATNPKSDAIGSASGAYLHAAPQPEPAARVYDLDILTRDRVLRECGPVNNAPLYLHPPAAPSVPAGWRLVPVEPTKAHLNSIAMRHHHRFGLLPPEQQENVRAFARQMYEECTGQGFYKIDAAPSGEEEVTRLVRWLTAPSEKGAK